MLQPLMVQQLSAQKRCSFSVKKYLMGKEKLLTRNPISRKAIDFAFIGIAKFGRLVLRLRMQDLMRKLGKKQEKQNSENCG